MSLTDTQKQRIAEYVPLFRQYMESGEHQDELAEREQRTTLYTQLLALDALDELTELELGQLITSLWAYQMWGNKGYVVNKIVEDNGLPTLREALKDLLWARRPLEKRFDDFCKRIKGMGPASVTELLAFVHPHECGLWNDKARKALKVLGFESSVPFVKKYHITGKQYVQFNDILRRIREELQAAGLPLLNLVGVDYFLYFIWETQRPEPPQGEDYDFDHDEVIDKLVAIGQWMGFEAEKEKTIARGARVDVIWRAQIANLGVVTYVFEVQRSGAVDSLILNLQKAMNNPSVQRLVVVANTKNLKRVENEISMLDPKFVNAVTYLEASDAERAAELIEEFSKIIGKLELVRSEF